MPCFNKTCFFSAAAIMSFEEKFEVFLKICCCFRGWLVDLHVEQTIRSEPVA